MHGPTRRLRAVTGALALLLGSLVGPPAWAHHAFSDEFDTSQAVRFDKATITKMEWTEPHVWIHIDVERPAGTVEPWVIEAGPPGVLLRRGFTRASLLPGTEIVVNVYRAKHGTRVASGRDVTLPDGRTLFLGPPGTGAPGELRSSGR